MPKGSFPSMNLIQDIPLSELFKTCTWKEGIGYE